MSKSLCKCSDQFKTNTTSTKFFIWIITIFLFGLRMATASGNIVIRKMMITNNKINPKRSCISDKINRFDTAIQRK